MVNWRKLTPTYRAHMETLDILALVIVNHFSLQGLQESLRQLGDTLSNGADGLAEVLLVAGEYGEIEAIPDDRFSDIMGRWEQRLVPKATYRYRLSQEVSIKDFKRWQVQALIDLVRERVWKSDNWSEFVYNWPSPSDENMLLLCVAR